jgi:hypothetical protein
MATQLKYRGIEEWNRKLQNMYTILTATEGLGKLIQDLTGIE